MRKGFFAYSSNPSSSGECIEEVIKRINSGQATYIKSWTKLGIAGEFIITNILEAIDECDYFCADLTGFNDNVLFEIGYAIGKRKPVWLIFDTSYEEFARKYKEFGLLSTIGYTKYSNSRELEQAFYSQKISDASRPPLLDSLPMTQESSSERSALLYLKSQIDTDHSQLIVGMTRMYKLPTIIDDPIETKIDSLSWYLDHLAMVPALIAEFSATSRLGYALQNSKCSLIAGLAIGFGYKVLMVAERPYDPPLDYRHLLHKYSNKIHCEKVIKPFFESLHGEIAQLMAKQTRIKERRKAQTKLQNISFGEIMAEHETESIQAYYVETAHYQSLLKKEYNIVIGRKGSGKTATLYYLQSLLEGNPRNHVCLIKPINFEFDGLIKLLEGLKDDFEQGFCIESVWKFLVYTEIGRSLYEYFKSKPLYALSDIENQYISYVEENQSLFLSDLSTRLEEQLQLLQEAFDLDRDRALNQRDFRSKVSEFLHAGIIHSLRERFADLLSKNDKIIVLIDNLDKSWKKDSRLGVLSKIILGLLGVTGRIVYDFSVVKSRQKNLNFQLMIFLRSDIFKYILKSAREPDKIEYSRLRWEDPEILLKIIEERFVQLGSGRQLDASDLWSKYITGNVDGVPVVEYIIGKILPRPRDIIYFLNSAHSMAISRGHEKIEEADIKSAYDNYSGWVFKSILVENGVTMQQMEDFMYQLMGSNAIISRAEIMEYMKNANVPADTSAQVDSFIDHLVTLTVVGREVFADDFRFEYEFETAMKIKALSNKLNTNRFKIHNALLPYLECQ